MTLPLGYRYASLYAGIRKDKRDDLGLIVSDTPAAVAAVFTANQVQAAPVKLARKNLEQAKGRTRAIPVNAGNANCATRTGSRVALDTTRAVAKVLKIRSQEVLPASTGVIGVELDAGLITKAVPALVKGLAPDRFEDVARAIMTTDTKMKVSYSEVAMGGGTDVALETADAAILHGRVGDVALMTDLSKRTMRNITQNIVIALGLKGVFLVTTIVGITGLWPAILADTGATVLVTMNALRLLRPIKG